MDTNEPLFDPTTRPRHIIFIAAVAAFVLFVVMAGTLGWIPEPEEREPTRTALLEIRDGTYLILDEGLYHYQYEDSDGSVGHGARDDDPWVSVFYLPAGDDEAYLERIPGQGFFDPTRVEFHVPAGSVDLG